MSRLLFMITLFLHLPLWGGTAVGNFSFINEKSFDFRIGYDPATWKLEENQIHSAVDESDWYLSNKLSVSDKQKVSSLKIHFEKNFPAINDQELLTEIKKRHPNFSWKPLQNEDFLVGFVSNQIFVSEQRTLSYEYYFSKKNFVIGIEIYRDKENNGAGDVDFMRSIIRRASGKPSLVSVSKTAETPSSVNVGDLACYKIVVDILRTDFNADSLTEFNVRGALPHWSFKSITWNQKDAAFQVCMKVSARFKSDGLRISRLSLGSSDQHGVSYIENTNTTSPQLISDKSIISYENINVINPSPIQNPPKVTKVSADNNNLLIEVTSGTPLANVQVLIENSEFAIRGNSFLFYEDEVNSKNLVLRLDPLRLPQGYTKIRSILFMDKVGNATLIYVSKDSKYYSETTTNSESVVTQIPFVYVGVKK